MPLTIFFVWRIFLEIIGVYFNSLNLADPAFKNFSQTIWWRWDSNFYGSIVSYGYNIKNGLQSNVTFFPLFPLLWKTVMFVSRLPSHISALIISNVLALGSFVIFYRWLLIVWDSSVAKRGLIALAVFPASFFLISVYSESTLLILIVTAFLLIEYKKLKLAAVVSMLASAARPVGIFMWPILIWFWFEKTKNNQNRNKIDFLSVFVLPPFGILFFSLYLWYKVDDPLAWFHGQADYGRNLISPIGLLYAYIKNILIFGESWVRHLFEMVTLLFVAFCLPELKKIHPAYAVFAIANLIPSLFSNTLTSIWRFALMIVLIFVVVARQKNIFYFLY